MGMWSPINLTAIYHSKVTDSITMPFLVSKQNYIITHIKVVVFKRIYISTVNLSTAFHYKKDVIYSPSCSFYHIYVNASCVLKTIIICKSCQNLMWNRNSTNRLNYFFSPQPSVLEERNAFYRYDFYSYTYVISSAVPWLPKGRRIFTCIRRICSK